MGRDQFPIAAAPTEPWHMWGNTVQVNPTRGAGAAGVIGNGTAQLFRVSYRRPETWSFFVAARIISGVTTDVDAGLKIAVDFMPGVGRTFFDTADLYEGTLPLHVPFVYFFWSFPAGSNPADGHTKKWTCRTHTPLLDDSDADSAQILECFPAQNIQAKVQSRIWWSQVSAVNQSIVAEVSAWVAPRTHVRPDWFSDNQQFLGAETQGT